MAGFANDVNNKEILIADNVNFSGDGTVTGKMTSDGQLLIGSSVAPNIRAGTLTAGSGISITNANGSITLSGTGSVPLTFTTSSGNAVASGNVINLVGTGSITTIGAGSTVTSQLTGLTNHAIQIGAGTATLTQLAAGTTGQILQTNTGADPTWSTATYPSTAGASGNVLKSDGTNWTSSAAAAAGSSSSFSVMNTSANPANATTYYVTIGTTFINNTASISLNRYYVPVAGTINKVFGNFRAVAGSNENVTIALRKNDTTNSNITTTLQITATDNPFNSTTLGLAVSAGDFINLIVITPTWVTPPTSCSLSCTWVVS